MKPLEVARRKLVDRLLPRPEDGALVGLLATTYEFQTEFFELDFLPSLLGIGAWDDRSIAGRVLLEKALAGMEAACVCVDARRYRARPQSLRVSVVPVVAGAGAAFHPKVLLLVYEASVKLLVGSANLTSPGYRANREVVSVLEVSAKKPDQAHLIRAAALGLARFLGPAASETTERVVSAALARLPAADGAADAGEWFAWSGPGARLWEDFVARWPAGEPIERLRIVSPFWSEEPGDGPLERLLGHLHGRGLLASGARLELLTDARPSPAGELLPVLPLSFERFSPRRFGITATAHAVDPAVLPQEVDGAAPAAARRLHAKLALAEGPTHALLYVGSANFSSHGWGFAADPNVEAGLLLLRAGRARGELQRLVPATIGRPVELAGAAQGKLLLPDEAEVSGPWPSFVRELLLRPSDASPEMLELEVLIEVERVAGAWSLHVPGAAADALASGAEGGPPAVRVPLGAETLAALLREKEVEVRWWAANGAVRFPLNVALAARDDLPLAPGAGRLGEDVLLAYYQGRIRWEDLYQDSELDEGAAAAVPGAGSTVDTSRIQSYQIRAFVEALSGIKDELRAAAAAPVAMRLAVLGPVSPVALARHVHDAVRAGQRSPVAGAFQLVEIGACLREAMTYARDARLAADWHALVVRAQAEVSRLAAELREQHGAALPEAFASYERAIEDFYRGQGESP